MRRYFYRMYDMWLSCFAMSRAHVLELTENGADEVLTEREAVKRTQSGDEDLAHCLRSTIMCDLMCN